MQFDDKGVVHGFEDESFGKSIDLLLLASYRVLVDYLHRVELVCIYTILLYCVSFTIKTCPKAPLPKPLTTLKSVIAFTCLCCFSVILEEGSKLLDWALW